MFFEYAAEQGWNAFSQIEVLLDYIVQHTDEMTFEDFLAKRASDENGFTEDEE
jgi:hypothetical protein